MADTKALRAWVAEAAGTLGGLDVFVANVSALAQAMDEDSWRRSLDIDVLGTVAGIEAAIPFLEKSPCGAIVVLVNMELEWISPSRVRRAHYKPTQGSAHPHMVGLILMASV